MLGSAYLSYQVTQQGTPYTNMGGHSVSLKARQLQLCHFPASALWAADRMSVFFLFPSHCQASKYSVSVAVSGVIGHLTKQMKHCLIGRCEEGSSSRKVPYQLLGALQWLMNRLAPFADCDGCEYARVKGFSAIEGPFLSGQLGSKHRKFGWIRAVLFCECLTETSARVTQHFGE
jgi:hypothetical protein